MYLINISFVVLILTTLAHAISRNPDENSSPDTAVKVLHLVRDHIQAQTWTDPDRVTLDKSPKNRLVDAYMTRHNLMTKLYPKQAKTRKSFRNGQRNNSGKSDGFIRRNSALRRRNRFA